MKISNQIELQSRFKTLPEIKRNDVEIIYENEVHDGPTEGLCKWQSKYCYFMWSGQMDKQADVIVRSFLMILLTAEQLGHEKKEHARFIELSKSNELSQYYVEREKIPSINVDVSQLVGWFRD